MENSARIPDNLHQLCQRMQNSLGEGDGFRRQATPALIYRYFVDMQKMFQETINLLKSGGKFGLIVGHNKTTLGGTEFLLDTPNYLVSIAKCIGWEFNENIELEPFRRYGKHSKNSGKRENLIILSRS